MKQMNVTTKKVGEITYFIRPFPAFYSANLSGELSRLIVPIASSCLPLLELITSDRSLDDIDMAELVPSLQNAFSKVEGDEVESMMKKLLIRQGNVSYTDPETGATRILDEDSANEVFCSEIQDMYALCIEVIKVNFKGFFKRLRIPSGSLNAIIAKKPILRQPDTAALTQDSSLNSNSECTP